MAEGRADLGFVPLENAIEGTVSATIDGLIHDVELHIQREVVMDIHLHLMARPGTAPGRRRSVASYPHALAQCQKFLAATLPGVEQRAANSTADAARVLGESGAAHGPPWPPGWPRSATDCVLLAEDVEDHADNQTRFVLLAHQRTHVRPGTTRRASSAFSRPTTRAASTGSWGSSRRGTST